MISDPDLQALVELQVEQGDTFGTISKAVRTETGCGLREAIELTMRGLSLAVLAGNEHCGIIRDQWLVRDKLGETV